MFFFPLGLRPHVLFGGQQARTYLAVNARRGEGGWVLRYGVEADVRHVEVESLRIVLAAQPHYSPAHVFGEEESRWTPTPKNDSKRTTREREQTHVR